MRDLILRDIYNLDVGGERQTYLDHYRFQCSLIEPNSQFSNLCYIETDPPRCPWCLLL